MTPPSEFPELDNHQEIERLIDAALPAKILSGIGKALQNVTLGIANTRSAINGLRSSVSQVNEKIERLDQNINKASISSDKLTEAIKNITLWGTIIAGLGVLVALGNLVFEILKYLN